MFFASIFLYNYTLLHYHSLTKYIHLVHSCYTYFCAQEIAKKNIFNFKNEIFILIYSKVVMLFDIIKTYFDLKMYNINYNSCKMIFLFTKSVHNEKKI